MKGTVHEDVDPRSIQIVGGVDKWVEHRLGYLANLPTIKEVVDYSIIKGITYYEFAANIIYK